MRKSAQNVRASVLSDHPRDKLAAALNCWVGMLKQGETYDQAPMYFDACWEWFQKLPANEQDAISTIVEVIASPHKNAALGVAASLPPAPRNPL